LLLALKEHIRAFAQRVALTDCRVAFSAQSRDLAFDPLALFDVSAQEFVAFPLEREGLLAGCRSRGVHRRTCFVALSDQ
jgi:hypothetical protein